MAEAAKMNPGPRRGDTDATTPGALGCSIAERNAWGLLKRGVMSLKMMPGLRKSGMSRMQSESIDADGA
jgi:hypothetical protein